jgi:hypothetical protein
MTDPADDVERGAFFKLRIAFEVPIEQHHRITGIGCDEREPILGRCSSNDLVTLVADGVDQTLHGTVGYGVRTPDFTGNQQHPTLLAHQSSSNPRPPSCESNLTQTIYGIADGGTNG